MGKVEEELEMIEKQRRKVTSETASDLYRELIEKTPVDTGQLKDAWELNNMGEGEWLIQNPMEYANKVLQPYNKEARVGSMQLPAGIEPIIEKHHRILQNRLKVIK